MKTILFILLMGACNESNFNAYPYLNLQLNNGVILCDDNAGSTFKEHPLSGQADSRGLRSIAIAEFKKVVVFESRKDLDCYLSQNNVDGKTLIDVKRGKQFTIRQQAVMDTVTRQVKEATLRGYRVKMEEEK